MSSEIGGLQEGLWIQFFFKYSLLLDWLIHESLIRVSLSTGPFHSEDCAITKKETPPHRAVRPWADVHHAVECFLVNDSDLFFPF